MTRAWLMIIALRVLIITILAVIPLQAGHAQSINEIDALIQRSLRLYSEGKFAEATPVAKQAYESSRRALGENDPWTIVSASNLALLYHNQSRLKEAEPLYKFALAGYERGRGREHPETLTVVNRLASLYRRLKRFGESQALYERALEGYKRTMGEDHPHSLAGIHNVATLYSDQGRDDEAAVLHKRALAARERVLGREHPDTLISVSALGLLHLKQKRYSEAELLLKRAAQSYERLLGREHPETLASVNDLAALYKAQQRYDEAEPLYKHVLAMRERTLGRDHSLTSISAALLATLYHAQNRYSEVEPLLQRVIEASERAQGKDHPDTLASIHALAMLYYGQGRDSRAEPLLKRSLEVYERVLGKEHPDTLISANNLATLYDGQGRYSEAEPILQQALTVSEKVLGAEHHSTLTLVHSLAVLYHAQGRYAEAEPLYKRVVETSARVLGKDDVVTLTSAGNLAGLYLRQGRYSEAETLYTRAIDDQERAWGKANPTTLTANNGLALVYGKQGRYRQAEALLKQTLEVFERVRGKEHSNTLASVGALAELYFEQSDWTRSAALWRRSTAGLAKRSLQDTQAVGQLLTGERKSEAAQNSIQFLGLVKAVHRLAAEGNESIESATRETFLTAQWALGSEAAQSLAQMAARGAKDDPKLAALVRERQDLVTEWRKRDRLRNATLGQPSDQRSAKAEAEKVTRLAAIDTRVIEIDNGLAAAFPDYAAFANPEPLSVEGVQQQLSADEALVLFLDTPEAQPTPEETFVWVVTRTQMRWVRSKLGRAALTREVQALRCGLDAAAWAGSGCAELTGQHMVNGLPPFDHARAHQLYKGLFNEIEDLIKGKHLLVVPSGALTQLPFHVLVTRPPVNGDHRSAAWLIRDHAVTVLPAASSLKALRRLSRPSAAPKPLIGFGNPLLEGSPDGSHAARVRLAREKQSCPRTAWERLEAFLGLRNGGTRAMEIRGGLADLSIIREQIPLPETVDELCTVAREIGADVNDLHFGANATEHAVKTLSRTGVLAQYRIVHFATHGATAGQLSEGTEPGLILTPPKEASDEDDGYLSGSEIAALKLDADWVILSACSTAAGNAENSEALSGLARAFIYAQARALLVSHWDVGSQSTVKLITAAMREIARDKTIGRAEGLRRAMLALIGTGDTHQAHPAYWAPFILVGEGGAR